MKSKQVQEFKETEIGKIPKDWEVDHLENIIETILDRRGITPKKLNSDWVQTGWPVISAKNIKNGQLIRNEIIRFVDDITYQKWMSKKIKIGDIILTSEGPLGELYHVEDFKEFCLGQRLFAIRCNTKKINDNFLFFYLSSIKGQQELSARATGSTVAGIRQEQLRKILVCFPKDTNEQHRIGKILYHLNTKIKNLQNQNPILEQTAQAIFQSWFIDFDGATEFEDSELGKIPKGWKVKTIGDLCEKSGNGGTPRRNINEYWNNGTIPWIKTGELSNGPILDTEEKITEYGLQNSSCKIWDEGTILVAMYGATAGKLGYIIKPSSFNQACNAMTAKQETGNMFLFFTLKHNQQILFESAVGAAQQNLNKDLIAIHKIIVPPSSNCLKFQKLVKPLFNNIVKNMLTVNQLTKTRDALLPKLMSGEIRV